MTGWFLLGYPVIDIFLVSISIILPPQGDMCFYSNTAFLFAIIEYMQKLLWTTLGYSNSDDRNGK